MVRSDADNTPGFVYPDWPVPENIRAICTTRLGGYSEPPWNGLNLGAHVGDDPEHVAQNRQHVIDTLDLPSAPFYLNQVHKTDAVCADDWSEQSTPVADACWSTASQKVVAIMTADCLPVLFASHCGEVIAGAHAGWRGLADGVLETTIQNLPVDPTQLTAWLGPAIGPDYFEVGGEVLEHFVANDAACETHFTKATESSDKYFADLFGLARDRLGAAGLKSVYGGGLCTFSDKARFFSHRRDSGSTGRMAAMIWKI